MAMPPSNDERSTERDLPARPAVDDQGQESEAKEGKKAYYWLYILAVIGGLLGGIDAHYRLAEEEEPGFHMGEVLAGGEAVGGALVGGIFGWLIDMYREKQNQRGRS